MGDEEGTSDGGMESSEQISHSKTTAANGCNDDNETVRDFGDGGSGSSEGIRTYKRRRQLRSSSDSSVQENGRPSDKAAAPDQGHHPRTESQVSMNGLNDHLQRQWRNVVLEHMYQSVNDEEGGMQRCIRDAMAFSPDISSAEMVKESNACNDHTKECSSQAGQIPNGARPTTEVLEHVRSNGPSKELNHLSATEVCQRVFFNIIISEKFTSLCKLLFYNFQGVKADKVFHLSLINSRMKDGVYENSPMLFSKDIQQVWRRLEDIGTELTSLTKGLSDMSRACYNKQFPGRESESQAKQEKTEACTCKQCGEKADGRDCLVCDACEGMYHVACIKPAIEEIPPKTWFCSNCRRDSMPTISPHENCVVCERLNPRPVVDNHVADQNHPINGETLVEEDTKCFVDDGLTEIKTLRLCKVCRCKIEIGEKFRTCDNDCESKYYHARCLTLKQVRAYGPHWYCPSCLCGACLEDKDDDKIVLCDGCDIAYHIYCMTPPCTSVPDGDWFCSSCEDDLQRIHEAKRSFEIKGGKMAFEDLGKKTAKVDGGVDMLLDAANSLNDEEKLVTT